MKSIETKTIIIKHRGEIKHEIQVYQGFQPDKDWLQAIRPDLAGVSDVTFEIV